MQIQSQLRVGLKDYGNNYANVKGIMSELSKRYAAVRSYPEFIEEL